MTSRFKLKSEFTKEEKEFQILVTAVGRSTQFKTYTIDCGVEPTYA